MQPTKDSVPSVCRVLAYGAEILGYVPEWGRWGWWGAIAGGAGLRHLAMLPRYRIVWGELRRPAQWRTNEQMMDYRLRVKLLHESAQLPSYAHPGDAGLDLFATVERVLAPGQSALIPTGICIQLPPGTEAQVRPRSGLALKHQVTVLNTPGTIDEGYRGEVGVILINHGVQPFGVTVGMKIAQMVIQSVVRVQVEAVAELETTIRGAGGFGSTGV